MIKKLVNPDFMYCEFPLRNMAKTRVLVPKVTVPREGNAWIVGNKLDWLLAPENLREAQLYGDPED